MSKGERQPGPDKTEKPGRIKFGRRPAWLMVLVLLVFVVLVAYQITVGLGVRDSESFFRELGGVLGIVVLFLLGGVVLGFLLVAVKSWLRRSKGPPRDWGDDPRDDGKADGD